MKISEIKQIDQKNRLHIPQLYLQIAGITEGDNVVVSCMTESKSIVITRLDDEAVLSILPKKNSNI